MHEAKARLERPTTVIHVEDRAGVTHAIEPVEGWRLMEILRDYGIGMDNTCGGALACAECHVLLDREWVAKVPPPREDELEKLDELPLIYRKLPPLLPDHLVGRVGRAAADNSPRRCDDCVEKSTDSVRQRSARRRGAVSWRLGLGARSSPSQRRPRQRRSGGAGGVRQGRRSPPIASSTSISPMSTIGADGAPTPLHYREKMRIKGPSVRLDLGKQARSAQAGEHDDRARPATLGATQCADDDLSLRRITTPPSCASASPNFASRCAGASTAR